MQFKPSPKQFEAISCHPIASYLGEETSTRITTTSFQVVVESDKVRPQPPLLQTEQPQFPQPHPIRLVIRALLYPCSSSLDTLQQLNVFPIVRGSKVTTELEVRSQDPPKDSLYGVCLLIVLFLHTASHT